MIPAFSAGVDLFSVSDFSVHSFHLVVMSCSVKSDVANMLRTCIIDVEIVESTMVILGFASLIYSIFGFD